MSLLKSSRHHRRDPVNLPVWNSEMQHLYLHRWQIFMLKIERPIADPIGADGRSERTIVPRPAGAYHPNQSPDCDPRCDTEHTHSPVQKVCDGAILRRPMVEEADGHLGKLGGSEYTTTSYSQRSRSIASAVAFGSRSIETARHPSQDAASIHCANSSGIVAECSPS